MMIRRVGIVAKHGLVAASEHVARLGAWLSERGIDVVYERETLALAGAIGEHVRTATRDALRVACLHLHRNGLVDGGNDRVVLEADEGRSDIRFEG